MKSTTLTRQILKADKLENPEFKILNGDSNEVKSKKLTALIKSEMPNISDEYLAENMERIIDFREMANNANASLSKLKEHSNPKAIFAHNKNLFSAAAHHRRSVEAELEVPERLSAYEKALNVPTREGLVQDSAKNILSNLNSQAVVNNAAERFGVDANKDSVKVAVENAVKTSEIEIPAQLDKVLGKLGFGDRVSVINTFINDAQEKIKAGDTETLQTFAENAHVKPDAAVVLKKLDSVKASLTDNPSNKQIAEAVSVLGYNNQIEMTADMYKSIVQIADSGMLDKEQMTALFGQNADKELANIGKNIKQLSDKQNQIERQLGLPSRKEVVLNILEKTGEVVPEKTLQAMQEKFDKVAEVKSESDSRIVDPSAKKPKVPDSMYLFTKEQKQQFAQIEQKLPSWNTYAKVNAKAVGEFLEPQLNDLYAEAGRLSGHLWIGSEGESGLFDNQSIKVLEMITGKPYYNEPDIDKVVAHIKKGEGSGTSSTNVDHRRYSGHAQYVAEVSPVEVIDPVTKERVMKDVLWHDNTWGRAEDSVVWTDDYGVERTDYGNGYGGPDGYIFDKRLLTGTFVEDTKVTPGILMNGQKFDLWGSTRIQGVNPSADESIDKMMNQIFTIGNGEQKVAEFEEAIKNSANPVNMEMIDRLDAEMSEYSNEIVEKITNGNIKTQEAIDKLPDEGMKFILDKTALQMSSGSKQVRDYLSNITDKESLNTIKENLPEIHKEMMAAPFAKGAQAPKQVAAHAQDELIQILSNSFTEENIPSNLQEIFTNLFNVAPEKLDGSIDGLKTAMSENAREVLMNGVEDKALASKLSDEVSNLFAKTIDEKVAIKSLDDMKQYGDMAETITKYVDKKFNTSSDADLLAAFKKLQNMSQAEFNEFMADATNEDLGIKEVTPLDVAKQVNAQKSVALELIQQNARLHVAVNEGPEDNNAPEWAYRNMKMTLSPIDNYQYVSKNGKAMFQQYGARAAFPKAEILSKEEIASQSNDFATSIADTASEIAKITGSRTEAAAQLNSDVKAFVNANVLPSQRERANSVINNYLKVLKKNPDEQTLLNAKEEVVDFISANHITTNTGELVQDFVNELQSPNPNEEKLSVLRDYLTAAVNTSDVASAEYSMIDNASNAIAAMTREKLSNYSVTTADGTELPMDSDEGINFLIDKLANPANNSTAVQVFFAQTGLSERAVDVISKTVHTEALPAAVQELEGQLVNAFGNIKTLDGAYKEFASDNTVSYSTYKDALNHYVKTLDKEYADKTPEEQLIYDEYKQFLMKTANSDLVKGLSSEEILPVLEQIHSMGIQSVSQGAIQGAEQLNSLSDTLENKISAMKALKLPKNSEKEQEREKFLASAKVAQEALEHTIEKVNEAL